GVALGAVRVADGDERVVALAEEAGVGAAAAEGLAPAEPAGHVDVGRQVRGGLPPATGLEVLADRAHARRVGVARVLVGLRLLAAGVAGQAVVAAGLVVEGAHQGDPVHPLRHARQVLADLHAGDAGADRPELAANFSGGGRLQVDHVLGG